MSFSNHNSELTYIIFYRFRGNHASICLRWLKLNQFLTLSSLPITIKQVLWWEYFSDVKLRYVSLLNSYSLMAILECWPWLALVVVFIAYNWRSLLFLLPIITVKASGAPPFLETFKQINKVLQDKSLNLWNIIYALNNYIVIRYVQ